MKPRAMTGFFILLIISCSMLLGATVDRMLHMQIYAPAETSAADVVGYRVMADLGNGRYLVEIRQRYVTHNPLPIGESPVELLVPHVVVLGFEEFEALRLTLGKENVPLSNQQTQ